MAGTEIAPDESVETGTARPDEGRKPEGKPAPAEGAKPDSTTEPDEDSLEAANRRARHFEAENKRAAKATAALQKELETFRESQKTEHEKALEQARKEGQAEAEKTWRDKAFTAARRAAAVEALTGRVVNVRLAMPHLDLSEVEVGDDGEVDAKALKSAVDDLLSDFPELAASSTSHTNHHADLGAKGKQPQGTGRDPNELLRIALRGRR